MRKFDIGDKVKIIKSHYPEMVGREATVTSELVPATEGDNYPLDTLLHELDLKAKNPDGVVAYPPDWLKPIYGGDEKIAWLDMVHLWQPAGIAA